MANWATAFLYVATILVLCDFLYMNSSGLRSIRTFWRWLKGSRMSFYLRLSDNGLEYQSLNMRGSIQYPIIELSRGLFRRRSALYGRNSENWKVAVGHWEVNSIKLQDKKGVSVKTALELADKYPSLQAMLDRIAELEKELQIANKRRAESRAAFQALRDIINADRQKYRSSAAQHIREFIEQVDVQATMMNEPNPSEEQVEVWKRTFHTATK